jgi:hypothetical protein
MRLPLIAALLASFTAAAAAAPMPEFVGARLTIALDDGRRLAGNDLVGLTLEIGDPNGRALSIRINGVAADPKDRSGEVELHDIAMLDSGTGAAQPYCLPDAQGLRAGILLPADGGLKITCTSGAIGKCIRFGYHPWKTAADGRPMADYHAACVRMVRADYCGDGKPNTEDGTIIDMYDRVGVQQPDMLPGQSFEAAWGPDGAVCVARTRKPLLLNLDRLKQQCPHVVTGPRCNDAAPGALLFNRSTH